MQVVDCVGVEGELVEILDPRLGSCDLLADGVGSKPSGNTDGLTKAPQHRPGELLADSAADRQGHGAVAVDGGRWQVVRRGDSPFALLVPQYREILGMEISVAREVCEDEQAVEFKRSHAGCAANATGIRANLSET